MDCSFVSENTQTRCSCILPKTYQTVTLAVTPFNCYVLVPIANVFVCLCALRYVWRATDWGECRILPLLSQQDRRLANISILCGGGIQTRKTYCVQVPDDSVPHHTKEGKKTHFHHSDPGLAGST